MGDVLKLVVLGRAARNASNLKNRQPLAKLFYNGRYELSDDLKELVENELNVKSVEVSGDNNVFVSYDLKPQLRTLGPKYGALLGKSEKFAIESQRNRVGNQVERLVQSGR